MTTTGAVSIYAFQTEEDLSAANANRDMSWRLMVCETQSCLHGLLEMLNLYISTGNETERVVAKIYRDPRA